MLRIYDEFLEDETILSLHDRSYRLHVSALVYCSRNLTDGKITDRSLKVLAALLDFPVKRHVAELEEHELWLPTRGGWRIKNYLEFNPDAATVKKERAQARERMRRMRARRAQGAKEGGDGMSDAVTDGVSDAAVRSGPVPSFEKALGLSIVKNEIDRSLEAAR